MFDATTILAYRGKNKAVIGGDGQVTFGNTILKGNATKIRTLYKDQILAGFAGSTADAFNLFDMFESHLEACKGDLLKSVIAFSKEWRKDKVLRRLEAMMIVLNKEKIFILSGTGDVVEPEDGAIASIGSGGNFAISAARALVKHSNLDEEELVRESLMIAGELCIYTNQNIKILKSSLKITKHTENGFVQEITAKDNKWTGEEWKKIFALNSTNFYLENYNGKLRMVTVGKGHDMGMSLYGANALAEKQITAATILSYYYPGTKVVTPDLPQAK